jgi:hypothetical protein
MLELLLLSFIRLLTIEFIALHVPRVMHIEGIIRRKECYRLR